MPARAADGGSSRARVVGDYVLGRTLGSGAVGKVKLGTHVTSGAHVALKIIRKATLRAKPALATKVRREVAVLKLLAGAALRRGAPGGVDAGVLQLLDVYETEQCVILVLEYCAGGDLFEHVIQSGYLANDEALTFFHQLVLALKFAHSQGITHRDLKLENLLLTADGRLKLADFGMAALVTPGSLLETACGSPNYCAPEVLSGELYDGAASDCWSLGVTLYAMVTGGLPFDDDNFSRLLAKVRSGIFFIPDEVDPEVAELIRGLLVVDPSERLSLDDVLASSWFRSQPLPAHMAALDGRDLKSCLASLHVPPDDTNEPPVTEPDMSIVAHLSELGLGETRTILRRLRSDRACVEKDFYDRISAFVTLPPTPRGLDRELPKSPVSADTLDSRSTDVGNGPTPAAANSLDSFEAPHTPPRVTLSPPSAPRTPSLTAPHSTLLGPDMHADMAFSASIAAPEL